MSNRMAEAVPSPNIPPTKSTPKKAPLRAPSPGAVAGGPGEEIMTRWTTVSIPTSLYNDIAAHVPRLASSRQAYVQFWTRAGYLIDTALAGNDPEKIPERVMQALQAIGRVESE